MKTEDGSIISKCLNGDHDAFGLLVDKYKDRVYALAYSRLHNTHNAEDVSQEVFIKVYEKLHTLRRWDRFAGWLYRMTIRLSINYLEAQSRLPEIEYIEDNSSEIFDNQMMDSYHAERKFNELHESLDSLSEEHREVLILHYFSGMTSSDISKFIGVSPDAIRRRLMRARSMLKEEILKTISIAFDEQKLNAGFTPRILEMTKHARINPIPREIIIPWGVSLTGALIATFLGMFTGLAIIKSYYDVPTTSESSGIIGPGQIPVYVTNKAEIESGGGTSMLSGKKTGAFVTLSTAPTVISGKAKTQWAKYTGNPVLDLGPNGSWDHNEVFDPTVVFDGNIYKMWYRASGKICYATSTDGSQWVKYSANPIDTGSSNSWDYYSFNIGSILFDGDIYKMWYSSSDYYNIRIGYATSVDGINWVRYPNPILDLGKWDSKYVIEPSVMFDGTIYKMWYCGHDGSHGRIGYATSTDGINWTKYSGNPIINVGVSGSLDSISVSHPAVTYNGKYYEMWYSGGSSYNSYGPICYATSIDGIAWKKSYNPALDFGSIGSWDNVSIGYPNVIFDGVNYKMWYTGNNGQNERIGYATGIMPDQSPITNVGRGCTNSLAPAFPNPANPEVWIPYQLSEDADVSVRIYTSSGQLVRTLELGYKSAGSYISNSKSAYWDGRNEAGEKVVSGIYFYNIKAGNFSATKKMIVKK